MHIDEMCCPYRCVVRCGSNREHFRTRACATHTKIPRYTHTHTHTPSEKARAEPFCCVRFVSIRETVRHKIPGDSMRAKWLIGAGRFTLRVRHKVRMYTKHNHIYKWRRKGKTHGRLSAYRDWRPQCRVSDATKTAVVIIIIKHISNARCAHNINCCGDARTVDVVAMGKHVYTLRVIYHCELARARV